MKAGRLELEVKWHMDKIWKDFQILFDVYKNPLHFPCTSIWMLNPMVNCLVTLPSPQNCSLSTNYYLGHCQWQRQRCLIIKSQKYPDFLFPWSFLLWLSSTFCLSVSKNTSTLPEKQVTFVCRVHQWEEGSLAAPLGLHMSISIQSAEDFADAQLLTWLLYGSS